MSDWPPVWILFVTYKRTLVSLQAIKSLKQYLVYPNLHWHICDDGSGETDDGDGKWHAIVLADEIGGPVTWHEMERQGPYDFNVGGNINRGMGIAQQSGCQIVLTTLDDWALTRVLDLRPAVDMLDTYQETGFVRLSHWVQGLSATCVQYSLPRLGCDYMWMRLIREWSLKNPWGSEFYLPSMQPYLAHLRFFDTYGWLKENCHPGITETSLCAQYNDYEGGETGSQILFPLGERFFHVPYRHIASRQEHYVDVAGDIDPLNIQSLGNER